MSEQDRAAEIANDWFAPYSNEAARELAAEIREVLAAAREEGRREGLEEAAICCDTRAGGNHVDKGYAAAIRALADKESPPTNYYGGHPIGDAE